MKKLKKNDRVRYYGTYNEYSEVATATVEGFNGDLIKLTLDRRCDDNGSMVIESVGQWAHRKQVRKLRKSRK